MAANMLTALLIMFFITATYALLMLNTLFLSVADCGMFLSVST